VYSILEIVKLLETDWSGEWISYSRYVRFLQ